MRLRLTLALLFLTCYLLFTIFSLSRDFERNLSTENALIEQTAFRSLVNELSGTIKNARIVVLKKQAGYLSDNDQIIDEINMFERNLDEISHHFDVRIDNKVCFHCHVSLESKVASMDSQIVTIRKLVNEYKLEVSFLFTVRDADMKKLRQTKIAQLGDKIIESTAQITHVTDKMLAQMDVETRQNYQATRQNVFLVLTAGLVIYILVIVYLFITTNVFLNRLRRRISLIVGSNFSEKIEPEKIDHELRPLVVIFNDIIDQIRAREQKLLEKSAEVMRVNYNLEELKLTMEGKVRARTEEVNQVNKELIEQRLKLEKTLKELQSKTKELEENNKRLQELDRMKSEFIQMANHEIRTPMVTIKGYTDLILNNRMGEVSEKAMGALKTMSRNTDRLISIVENIRSYTLLESKRKELRFKDIVVRDFLSDVYADMSVLTAKRNQHLKLELQADYPQVTCDSGQIYQAIVNLVINAIRYSPDDSEITVSAIYKEGEPEITFYVKDTGMGIEAKEIKNIFLPFYEVKNIKEHHSGTIEFNSGGTGLGLAIVKKIIEYHDGRVWVESEGLWKGSTFYFSLPLRPKFLK